MTAPKKPNWLALAVVLVLAAAALAGGIWYIDDMMTAKRHSV